MEIFGIILTLFSFFGISVSPSIKTEFPPPPPVFETVPDEKSLYPDVYQDSTSTEGAEEVAQDIDPAVLAQCLTSKEVKFYGAFWCGHCADQKKIFGEAIQYIDYVECDAKGENPQTEACVEEKIIAYPTWIFADGEQLVGTQQLKDLAYASGC